MAIFFVVAAVLIAELIWWMIFIHQNNTQYLALVRHNYKLERQLGIAEPEYVLTEATKFVDRKFTMFVSESIFVIIVILIGIYFVYRSFVQELKLQAQQQNFLLSITHELKTPLASIKLYLQTLIAKKHISDEKRTHFLKGSLRQVDRLTSLINHVLETTKSELSTIEHQASRSINISEIITELLSSFEEIKENAHHISKDVYFKMHTHDLELLCSNLLKNALQYVGDNIQSVHVSLEERDSQIILEVSDRGVGIAEEEKANVFERFYRVGSEETRSTSGTGLGLYIVKQIVQKYHGQITIRDNEPNGSIFTILFDKAEHG